MAYSTVFCIENYHIISLLRLRKTDMESDQWEFVDLIPTYLSFTLFLDRQAFRHLQQYVYRTEVKTAIAIWGRHYSTSRDSYKTFKYRVDTSFKNDATFITRVKFTRWTICNIWISPRTHVVKFCDRLRLICSVFRA